MSSKHSDTCDTTIDDVADSQTVLVHGHYPINGTHLPFSNCVDRIEISSVRGTGYNGNPNTPITGTHIMACGRYSGIHQTRFVPDQYRQDPTTVALELAQHVRTRILERFHADASRTEPCS